MTIPVTILYGSQTNCSQDVARRVGRELRRLGFTVHLSTMDAYPIDQLPYQRFVIFICSTTGQGQVPDNMAKFWSFLLRVDLPPTALKDVNYSVFGLGDRSYPMYNAVARRLDTRLQALGAHPFSEIGLGDDQHSMGYDGGLIIWQSTLLKSFYQECSVLQQANVYPSADYTTILGNLESTIAAEEKNMNNGTATNNNDDDNNNNTNDGNTETTNTTPLQTSIATDYLAGPICSVTLIRQDKFDYNEFSELVTESPTLRDIFYNAMIAPLPSNELVGQNITEYHKNHIIDIMLKYIQPTTNQTQQYSNYHLNNIPHVFNNELLIEEIINYDIPTNTGNNNTDGVMSDTLSTNNDNNNNNNKKIPKNALISVPPQLTSKYTTLPVISNTPLVSDTHKTINQSVNHITYDFSSLLLQQPQQQNNQQTLQTNVDNPAYLPGDTLEVIPPTPDVLINTMLTLYNISPNDLILITTTTPQFEQILQSHNKTTHHTAWHTPTKDTKYYPTITEVDSLTDLLFDLMEMQEEINNDMQDENNKNNQDKLNNTILQRYESFPLLIPVWQLFTWYISLTFTPLRHHFLMLSQQATNPAEKERLTDFCSYDYASTLDSYCIRERRSIVEVFADFPSAVLPLQWVVELCDRIKPRQFSLASAAPYEQLQLPSSTVSSNSTNTTRTLSQLIPSYQKFTSTPQFYPSIINTNENDKNISNPNTSTTSNPTLKGSICLATVTYKTPFRRQKYGLCSSYLEDLAHSVSPSSYTPLLNVYKDRRNLGYTVNYPIREDLINNNPQISANQTQEYRIVGRIKAGSFRYHLTNHTHPILAVGPGTGIAALHAIVEYRIAALYAIVFNWITKYQYNSNNNSNQEEQQVNEFNLLCQDITNLLLTNNNKQTATLTQSSTYKQQYYVSKQYNDDDGDSNNTYNVEFSNTTILQQIINKLKQYITNNNNQNESNNNKNETIQYVNDLIKLLQHYFNPNQASLRLLFGSRSISGDHFYRDFFNYAVRIGVLAGYHSVFSRVQQITEDLIGNPILTSDNLQKAQELAISNNIDLKTSCIKPNQVIRVDDNSTDNDNGIAKEQKEKEFYVQHLIDNNPEIQQYIFNLVAVGYDQVVQDDNGIANEENGEETFVLDYENIEWHNHSYLENNNTNALPLTTTLPTTQLSDAGTIIVAGNAKKMPVDVQNTITNLVYDMIKDEMAQSGMKYNITFVDVKKYINIMAKRGRYVLECWM